MNKGIAKSMGIWAAMIPLAIANGALRELVLLPLLGGAAHPVSGLLLCVLLYLVVSLFLPRLAAGLPRLVAGQGSTYRKMGLVWVGCTVVFETLLGLLGGDSIGDILNNYNLFTGNLWLLVVVFFGLCPWLVAKRKKLI